MFEQENLEQHFRDLAQKHESPYNPADWADMQARLQRAGLTTPVHSPLRSLLGRSVALVALFLLVGVRVWYETPLPAHVVYALPTLSKQKNNSTSNSSSKTSPSANDKTVTIKNKLPKNSTPSNEVVQAITIPEPQNVAIVPPISVGKAGKDNIAPEANPDNALVSPILVQDVDSITRNALPTEVQPVGFSSVEPFMQKGITDLPALPTPEDEKDKKEKSQYQHLDIYTSEALHTNLAFKIGTERTYSIFHLGYQFSGGGRLAVGFGVGKEIRKKERGSLNLEGLFHYIKENSAENQLNLLGQAKLQFNRKFTPRLVGFMGLSANLLVTDYRGEDLATSAMMPEWAILRMSSGGTNIKMWTGLNVGLSIRMY